MATDEDGHRKQWQAMRLWYAGQRLLELSAQARVIARDMSFDCLADVGPEDTITTLIPNAVTSLSELAHELVRAAEDVRP